jgi:hypothetical protein
LFANKNSCLQIRGTLINAGNEQTVINNNLTFNFCPSHSQFCRRSYVLASATKVWREGTIFEHFMIVGLPPNYQVDFQQIRTAKPPEILYHFPENQK